MKTNAFMLVFFSALFIMQASAQYSWNKLPTAQLPSFKKDTLSIRAFGAIPDGGWKPQ